MKTEIKQEKFTKYEITRILGARALQIAMDAPLLEEIDEKKLEEINYDPMKIANIEFESNVLPISVKRPMPQKKSVKIKKIKDEREKEDREVAEGEALEEKEIEIVGEIMELATPEDELVEEGSTDERESSEELR